MVILVNTTREKIMKEIREIRSDYIDDENYRHVDAWFTNDEEEEGKTVALFCEDTGKHFYIDNVYSLDTGVKTTLEILKQDWDDTQPCFEFWMGDINVSCNSIKSLKLFSESLAEAIEDTGMEYSNNITDLQFAIDSEYQLYHNLGQDDWDLIDEDK